MAHTLHIEKLVYGGSGLSRLDGRVILTPLVLPGETVVAEPVDQLHAQLLRVEQSADDRVSAPCPYFGVCGGCHYQHAPYEYQLKQKEMILREVLTRIGKIEPPETIEVISGPEWAYRNRVQLHIDGDRIGYRQLGSHELCPITHCPISSPKLNEVIAVLNTMVRDARFPRFVRTLELFTNETDVQINVVDSTRRVARHFFEWCAGEIAGFVPGPLEYSGFRVSGQSFFQVNRFLAEPLVQASIGDAVGDHVYDLYAGVGLFSLPLSERFEQVTAVESGSAAVRDLQFNAERAGRAVAVIRASVDDYLAALDPPLPFVLADPPRSGLGRTAVRHLLRLRPERLHIVACDPSTLARDLRLLLDAGYRITRMVLVDLFPQTYHLETVVHLTR